MLMLHDRNDVAFGAGVTTAPVIDVDGAGRPYIDMPGNIATYKVFGNTLKAGRLSAAYPFAFGRVMKQYLVLTATRSRDYAVNRRFGLANTAEPGLAANNLLQFRAYLDDPRAHRPEPDHSDHLRHHASAVADTGIVPQTASRCSRLVQGCYPRWNRVSRPRPVYSLRNGRLFRPRPPVRAGPRPVG
jgi:hypothetical protein